MLNKLARFKPNLDRQITAIVDAVSMLEVMAGGEWVAATAKSVGQHVRPTTYNEFYYHCDVAGTTHATTEPTWPTTLGSTVTDGTVTWMCAGTIGEY